MAGEDDPFQQDPTAPGNVLSKRGGFELLRTLPGIDPVLAVLDGRPESLPWMSWIISARVAPGYDGVLELYSYTDPEVITRPLEIAGSRANGGGSIAVDLARSAMHRTIYENPGSPDRNMEPYNRKSATNYAGLDFSEVDVVELGNGGRLLDEKVTALPTPPPASMITSLLWMDIDRLIGRAEEVTISRVVGHHLGAMEDILLGLGRAMGLTPKDAMLLAETIDRKINPPLKF